MPVSEIHHAALIVSDLERSVAFYRDGLGYRHTMGLTLDSDEMRSALRIPPGTTGRSAFLQGPTRTGQLELIEWDGSYARPRDAPASPANPGFYLLSFSVPADEIHALHRRLTELGGNCYDSPRLVTLTGFGPIEVFLVEDPDGILLELVVFPSDDVVREHWAAQRAAVSAVAD